MADDSDKEKRPFLQELILATFPDAIKGSCGVIGTIVVAILTAIIAPLILNGISPSSSAATLTPADTAIAIISVSTASATYTLTYTPQPSNTATATSTPTSTPSETATSTSQPTLTLIPPTTTQLTTPTQVVISIPTATRGYPCSATVISENGAKTLYVVRSNPSVSSSLRDPIQVGQTVLITRKSGESNTGIWYRIADSNNQLLGWIPDQYLSLSHSCPQ